jgi:Domain of unknown function (DUF4386)
MSSARKTALVTGILFLLTFVFSIAAVLLYGPVLHNANYIVGAGADARLRWGALFEIMLVISAIGTAIVLYPILKRQSEGVALAYVAARIVENMIIIVGILSLLAVVTLRHAGATGADAASLVIAGKSLVAIHKWTFLLGPGFLGAGVGNGMLLGWLMYRSGLVPRRLAMLGLIGGPLVVASGIAVLFGAYEQTSKLSGIATIPEILWEGGVLGIWLIVKGFKPSPVTSGDSRHVGVDEGSRVSAAAAA